MFDDGQIGQFICTSYYTFGQFIAFRDLILKFPFRNLLKYIFTAPIFSVYSQIARTPYLPFMLFGSTAIFAASIVLLCPETFSKKLPDTVEDAKNLQLNSVHFQFRRYCLRQDIKLWIFRREEYVCFDEFRKKYTNKYLDGFKNRLLRHESLKHNLTHITNFDILRVAMVVIAVNIRNFM